MILGIDGCSKELCVRLHEQVVEGSDLIVVVGVREWNWRRRIGRKGK